MGTAKLYVNQPMIRRELVAPALRDSMKSVFVHGAWISGVCGGFVVGKHTAAVVRGKRDGWNEFLGGALAGGVYVAAQPNIPRAIFYPLLFGTLSVLLSGPLRNSLAEWKETNAWAEATSEVRQRYNLEVEKKKLETSQRLTQLDQEAFKHVQ
uniref:NADH-ubiquinone oxidoreductase subunit B14.7 n=1 Tax=Arcella intermedia TaxID=1963864 RepID=A0A6B2LMI1_9EUKA